MPSIQDFIVQLRKQSNLLLYQDEQVFEPVVEEEEGLLLPEPDEMFARERKLAVELLDALDCALRKDNWSPPTTTETDGEGVSYVYGLFPQWAPMRRIVRGFLAPVRYLPLVENISEQVALYLKYEAMLPGGDYGLLREEHGGNKWHFHYIDKNRHRSNVILSFDTRWTKTAVQMNDSDPRPLFVERHAEGKADFIARPSKWKEELRASMHCICARDLKKGIEHFRCAKNGADPVWPLGATLTPHPSSALASRQVVGGDVGPVFELLKTRVRGLGVVF